MPNTPYPQSFYAASANPAPERSPLCESKHADVCIIGAGYTGLSAGLFLAEQGYQVVILEAARVGFGASGRGFGGGGSGASVRGAGAGAGAGAGGGGAGGGGGGGAGFGSGGLGVSTTFGGSGLGGSFLGSGGLGVSTTFGGSGLGGGALVIEASGSTSTISGWSSGRSRRKRSGTPNQATAKTATCSTADIAAYLRMGQRVVRAGWRPVLLPGISATSATLLNPAALSAPITSITLP